MTKRIFDLAMVDVGQQFDRPGSASLSGSHMAYGGSRKWSDRWEYNEGCGAGFAELHPDYRPTGEQFFQMLQRVPGVTLVEWQTSKAAQGNASDGHYLKRNMLVTSSLGSASNPFEFELTRNNHMKDRRVPFTVTACFKEPSPDLVPEAWRILMVVIEGKEFAPAHVREYREKVLKKWTNKKLNSQLAQKSAQKSKSIEPPGSASGPDVLLYSGTPSSGAVRQDATRGQLPDEVAIEKVKNIEPPGSASGPDVLPHSGPTLSGAVGQDTTRAQLPDENAMKKLKSIETPGSASGPDVASHPDPTPPRSSGPRCHYSSAARRGCHEEVQQH
jgi:hypothetical protein